MIPTEEAPAPRDLSTIGRWCLVLGTSLIVLFAAVFAAGIIGLAVGIRVGWWLIVPAIIVQAWFTAAAWREAGDTRRTNKVLATLAVGWLLILAAGLASQIVTDHSVDGRHYHSETARAIEGGWNPLRDGPLYPSGKPVQPDSFPKAQAVTAAVVLSATNDIDATRLVGVVLLVAAALVAIAGMEAAGARTGLAIAAGLVLTLNPVALAQLGTAMVDGIISSLLLASIVLALLWVWRHPPLVVLPTLAGALVLLVNTKFTGLVYVGLIVVPVILVAGLLGRLGRRLVGMIGGVILGTLVAAFALGYNPYVTNTLRHDHPMHPVYGPDSRDIGALYLTGEIRDMSDPERLLRSVLGESAGTSNLNIKVPLTFHTSEWSAFRSAGPRFGGFGPWFSAGLIIAGIAIVAALLARRSRQDPVGRAAYTLLCVAGICFLATLVQPRSFVARFAPQLWFVAPLVATAVLLAINARVVRVIAWVALGILFLDTLGVEGASAVWSVRNTRREEASLDRLRANAPLEAQFSSWRIAEARRLRDNGIRFRAVEQVTCPRPFVLSIAGSLERRPTLGMPPKAAALLCPVSSAAATG